MSTITQEQLDKAADIRSPEDVARYLAEEDQELDAPVSQDGTPAADGTPADTPQAEASTPAETPSAPSDQTPGTTTTEPDKIAGIVTPSGRVLPYGVLSGEREQRRAAVQRAAELESELAETRAQLAALQQQAPGKKARFTDAQIAEVEQDFPAQAEMMREINRMAEELGEVRKIAAQPAAAPTAKAPAAAPSTTDVDREFDEALAGAPLLAKYAGIGGAVWNRAVEIDKALRDSSDWQARPLAERFAEVQRLLSAETGIPVPQLSPGTTVPSAAPAAPAARAAVRTPETVLPETLSDLPGGSAPVGERAAVENMDPMQLANRLGKLDAADIESWIAKYG